MVNSPLSIFFHRHRDTGEKAIRARQYIAIETNRLTKEIDEVDIDVLLPFLLPMEESRQIQIAHLLGAARDIIDLINRKELVDAALIDFVKSRDTAVKIITIEEYAEINSRYRCFCGDLVGSYSASTPRVYYRIDILERQLEGMHFWCDHVRDSINMLSAFLLFDDDLVDIKRDLENDKKTILIDYLSRGGDMSSGIDVMIKNLTCHRINFSGFEKYNQFLEGIINVYI